jgi:hypothetical protein
MKSHSLAKTLLVTVALIANSKTSLAETCYKVEGTAVTENVTNTLQMGTMNLTLKEYSSGATVFNKSGSLVGNITGTDGFGATILSHTARFSQGNSFVTEGDKAVLVPPYVVDTLPDGITACSFMIHETITHLVKGTNLFKNVADSTEIYADGIVSQCPGEPRNEFTLSGQLCLE